MMSRKWLKVNVILVFAFLICINVKGDSIGSNKNSSIAKDSKPLYMGESFPVKYLSVDEATYTVNDLNHYISTLNRTITYFAIALNTSDANKALGVYFTKALLRRVLLESGEKFEDHQLNTIKDIIRKGDDILSHYVYRWRDLGWQDIDYRVSQLFIEDLTLMHSISDFNRNKLRKWILSKGEMHDYVKEIDDASLDKFKYVELTESVWAYFVDIDESDKCVGRVPYLTQPFRPTQTMQRCKFDRYCYSKIHSAPSIAYALSHRLFNLLLRNMIRRCYMNSAEQDAFHVNVLCAFMYRETVYIARRGYFARDMFLEHNCETDNIASFFARDMILEDRELAIRFYLYYNPLTNLPVDLRARQGFIARVALCALYGYEEYHRRAWFQKAAEWVDEDGCLAENRNFEINRTMVYVSRAGDDHEKAAGERARLKKVIEQKCHNHPMAVVTTVLALGIRHAVHYLARPTTSASSS